ncbi:AGC protein kinase [Phytophthora nicotianae P10297]|uniref:non-specific serine/threonine protein kinase n=1 Tax=Phytophthora nicotianae P10297 TaxID=1317064 RepID=W2Z6W8_PHYNI|nr:AGC protein kinase [Phytophthora nicotianae P10297]
MDNFEQLQLLGRGGYASVFLVRSNNSDELFALKRIPRSKIVTEQQKARLEAEKSIVLVIRSPFLCRGFQIFETTEEVSILQEFVDGRALYECVWKYKDTGRFPEDVAKFFAAQLVLALRDLHANGYIHRDFKSGNVLVGKGGFAKVIDFGLSKRVFSDGKDGNGAGRTQSVCGTHFVMAPEMFFKQAYGVEIDWWSLGVVIYEMVMGHPPWGYQCPTDTTTEEYFQRIKRSADHPFHGQVETIVSSLSPDLRSLICALLQINPHERLGTNGASEVMNHVWFNDVDWEQFETNQDSIVVPYDFNEDYNAARVRTPPGQHNRKESLSSAESIDPEDNTKYFADF